MHRKNVSQVSNEFNKISLQNCIFSSITMSSQTLPLNKYQYLNEYRSKYFLYPRNFLSFRLQLGRFDERRVRLGLIRLRVPVFTGSLSLCQVNNLLDVTSGSKRKLWNAAQFNTYQCQPFFKRTLKV